MFGLMTKKKHREAMEAQTKRIRCRDDAIEAADRALTRERETVARLIQRNRELEVKLLAARAEAEANAADAEKYRRSRANLKQYRKQGS